MTTTLRRAWGPAFELLAILIWSLFVGRNFLDFDPLVLPNGGDYPLNLQGFFIWPFLKQCGACVFWNGTMNGGSPAFADLFGAVLHPLVVVAVLALGVVNGSKVVLVGSLALAGLAQWWLARVLGLGRPARLWAAAMASAGGQLFGRLEMGHVVMMLSIASTSLILAPAVELGLSGRRRAAVALGVAGALALLSGQGYMLAGLALGIAPAFLIVFLLHAPGRLGRLWRETALSLGLAALLGAAYWLPMAHLWPVVRKGTDPAFGGAQPVAFSLVNLVVPDLHFFFSDVLGKKPIPGLYMNFIGWVPLVFVLVALRLAPSGRRRPLAFLLLSTVLVYWAASADLMKWLAPHAAFVTGLRHPMLIAPLGVPLLLGLAAWGMDLLLAQPWARVALGRGRRTISANLAYALVVPLGLMGLRDVANFGHQWRAAPYPKGIIEAERIAVPTQAEWLNIYLLDFRLIPLLLDQGLKINIHPDQRTWTWLGRQVPPARLELTTDISGTRQATFLGRVGDFGLFEHPKVNYAMITTTQGTGLPCRATSAGGNIDVDCESKAPGNLTVLEYNFAGWKATMDGQPAVLGEGPWLATAAPAGKHHYAFRYRPWDAPLGLFLSALGLVLSAWLWLKAGASGAMPEKDPDPGGSAQASADAP